MKIQKYHRLSMLSSCWSPKSVCLRGHYVLRLHLKIVLHTADKQLIGMKQNDLIAIENSVPRQPNILTILLTSRFT